jgi:hypothetical protein
MKTLLSSLWNKFVNGQPVTEGEHPLKTKRNGAFALGFLACLVLLFLWSVVIWPAIQRSVCRTIPTCIMPAVSLRIEHAKAAEPELHFGGKLPEYEIDLPFLTDDKFWQLPKGPEYKNRTLVDCQKALKAKGVTDSQALRYGCSIWLHENGAMAPDLIHPGGTAFGLCGRNVGNAKVWIAAHPKESSYEGQVEYCSSRFAKAYKNYSSSLFRAVVEHHCPSCALANQNSCKERGKILNKCYFQRVTDTANRLALLP